MPRYTRAFVPGGTFFFTVTLLERRRGLLIDRVDLLRQCFAEARHTRPFRIDAMVVLPDHLHCIWTLPPGDADFSTRWHAIKAGFSRGIETTEWLSERRQRKGERGIWQRRFREHVIRDEQDFERHVDYIHFSPVKHGYVMHPGDWKHSSFLRHVERGFYPPDWNAGQDVLGMELE
ncbi:MAG: REP-associated tyrosine transposase [Solimonas sp.]